MSLYRELAEHIAEGRGADLGIDGDDLHRWMVRTDLGSAPEWEALDGALDDLLSAYQRALGDLTELSTKES